MKQHTIKIHGQKFNVSSGYPDDQIQEVEAFLNQRIQKIANKSDSYNLTTLLVLTALNLADELIQSDNNNPWSQKDVSERIKALCDRLDNALS